MIHRALLAALIAVPFASASAAQDPPASDAGAFRIVGYLPEYRVAQFDPESARGLTDLVVFSAEPMKDGSISLDRLRRTPWARLQALKSKHGVRLLLCVGGWQRSAQFPTVAASPELRGHFVDEAIRLCQRYELSGIDLDWEHPKGEQEEQNYAALLSALAEGFNEHHLTVRVTIAPWQRLPRQAWNAIDAVQIMSYDHSGQHSTFEAAEADVKAVADQGAPLEKIVLGLPFYGRHTSKKGLTLTYKQIAATHHPSADVDEVESVYFNGPATIRRKTEFALSSGLGGVMVWELGQDASGNQSLLHAISEAVKASR